VKLLAHGFDQGSGHVPIIKVQDVDGEQDHHR
jgi:hypothetical protein